MARSDPLARTLTDTIHAGQVESLKELLSEHPGLAAARIVDAKGGSGTPLHAAADWPGYFPNGPVIVGVLIGAGADPSAHIEGSWHAETPLHWAASSDDVEVARALIDGGAALEATGASIAGGTPLDDAVGYGCWQVARLLVDPAPALSGSGTRRRSGCSRPLMRFWPHHRRHRNSSPMPSGRRATVVSGEWPSICCR